MSSVGIDRRAEILRICNDLSSIARAGLAAKPGWKICGRLDGASL